MVPQHPDPPRKPTPRRLLRGAAGGEEVPRAGPRAVAGMAATAAYFFYVVGLGGGLSASSSVIGFWPAMAIAKVILGQEDFREWF